MESKNYEHFLLKRESLDGWFRISFLLFVFNTFFLDLCVGTNCQIRIVEIERYFIVLYIFLVCYNDNTEINEKSDPAFFITSSNMVRQFENNANCLSINPNHLSLGGTLFFAIDWISSIPSHFVPPNSY